ncbi:uncharacterized protein CXQ87_002223 [Candidozyma duobushaemuli]|uniref:Pre-mRNA-splicing factor SYF2 n=2 Tax=Candidozyma TaxID=3303203 RepID=A0ABX8I367_9ASCO|nr:uncharacterized protein CXQ87_002223 [[Candida] duobushaemulonis]PVH14099.1 hypothetical protein CXQ87_002223 [[Candida] duobushaemulonis]QWU87705.1 hypothetical protein CA3LBN_001970 [[Candida] haemuloni]
MLRKAASVKRASSVAMPASSDSESDSDTFEAAMRRKSQKIANSVSNDDELQYDIDTPISQEQKEEKQEQGSKFLKNILASKDIRDKEREKTKIEWQRKNAKGMVFESEEYKQVAGDSQHTPKQEEKNYGTIYDLIKSKVTEQDLAEARSRYLERNS